jgi:hypothetical protein
MIVLPRTARLATDAQVDSENPWPGLSSYDESSHGFFSGRAAEVDELLRRILDEPLTVLFAKSGLGKTSLLQAGVFPRLRERNAFPILVRLQLREGSAPLTEQVRLTLFEELRARDVEHAEARPGETLWEYLHRPQELWTPQNRLVRPVIVFDQFEELFTLGRIVPADVARFREDLADLAENRIPAALAERLADDPATEAGLDVQTMPYKIVIALREDFLADLEGWRLSMPSLRRNRMRLLPLGPDQAMQAVLNDRTKHLVSEPLAREIVTFLSASAAKLDPESSADVTGPIVEPALLSLFCRGVNEQRRRAGKTRIDREAIERAKGTIVLGFYRGALADQPERVWTFIEENLITEHGYRNSYSVDDAIACGAITDEELRALINRHLLRHEHHLGADRVELTHDLLTKAVVEERDARRRRQRERHDRRQRWKMTAFAAACALIALLFAGMAQRASKAQMAAEKTSKDLKAMAATLQSAKTSLESESARRAATSERLAGQLKETAIQQAIAQQATNRANAETDRARSRELAALAETMMNDDPERAIALALAGLRSADTAQARSVLMEAAQYAWPGATLEKTALGGVPNAVSISPDGSRLAVLAHGRTISLWAVSSRQPSKLWAQTLDEANATSLSFSPDQTLIAVGRTTSIDLIDVAGRKPVRRLQFDAASDRRVVFSPDGRWLGSGGVGVPLHILDYRNERAKLDLVTPDGVAGFSILPDGKRIIGVNGSPLSAFAFDRQPDNTWHRTDYDLSSCMRPQSVSPGSMFFSATWMARACTYAGAEADPQALSPTRDGKERATMDIVWNTSGRAFAELLVAQDGHSQDLIVGRIDDGSRLESRIKGAHPSKNMLDKSQLMSVDDSGTRIALIDADEHQLVRVYSVAHHKPFLSRLQAENVAVAPDGTWIAVAGPASKGRTAIDVIPTEQSFVPRQLSAVRSRIDVAPFPTRIYASRDSVIAVLPTDPVTTAVFDAATGKRRFDPLVGIAQPLTVSCDLLLVLTADEKPSRLVRTRDGADVAPWEQRPLSSAQVVVRIIASSNRDAIAALLAPGPGAQQLTAQMYTVRGDRLMFAGQVGGIPGPSMRAPFWFQMSDDARAIVDASSGKTWAVTSTHGAAPRRSTHGRQNADGLSTRFAIQKSKRSGVPMFEVVRRADKVTLGPFAAKGETYAFSSDDRWLANWDEHGFQIVDTVTGLVDFSLTTDHLKDVAFVANNTILRLALAEDAMLVPLDRAVMQRFANWLAPDALTHEHRALTRDTPPANQPAPSVAKSIARR